MACFIKKVSFLGIALIVLFPSIDVVYAADPACGNAAHSWLPNEWAEYKGRSFTQRNHCGTTRNMVGTKDHSYWMNGRSEVSYLLNWFMSYSTSLSLTTLNAHSIKREGNNRTKSNDSWLKILANNFYGFGWQNDSIVCPRGLSEMKRCSSC